AIPRLRQSPRTRDAVLLGLGFTLQILTRPFEAALLAACVAPAVFPALRRHWRPVVAAILPALFLTLLHNHAVTTKWLTLPYMESRTQYGVPAAFTFQAMPKPQRPLVQEQAMDYQAQVDMHAEAGDFLTRLAARVKFLRFFAYAPLYVALLWFLPALRQRRYLWAAGCVALFALGTNFYPYFYPHYVAAIACLFVMMAMTGLSRMNRNAALILVVLCATRFMGWYGIHLFGDDSLFIATGPYQSWDYINFGDGEGRAAINRKLAASPGQQLVFVRYSQSHTLREWVHNEADIDAARVVWALDLGDEQNAELLRYFPKRTAWVVEPDSFPPGFHPAHYRVLPRPEQPRNQGQ
ncbi:MAG TPA: hypothetical protein VNH18_37190, partial [Bryobacteraceae bacterium]|nr:hypothetical protein [Bryobacteraceae bacterium]